MLSIAVAGLLVGLCAAQGSLESTPGTAASAEAVQLDAIMPPHPTTREDEYLCTSVELPDRPMKLTTVEPLADQSTVHHMLLFGCLEPARTDKVWPCRMSIACGVGGGENVLYGWGKNAPPIHLPAGSGFSVGPGTAIRIVVLQVHYLQLRESEDASGVKLHLTPDPVPYSAGLIAYAASFLIPPGKPNVPVINECCYSGFEPLHGFAFRVHTHKLGSSVHLEQTVPTERKRRGVKRGATRVAEKDPQLPQGFYPMDPPITILPGDKLKTTCEFNSTQMDHDVQSGHTSGDEMCNLYLMLYGELPFFMWCVDGNPWIHEQGPGGMPATAIAEEESKIWKAPHVVDSVRMPALDEGESSKKKKPSSEGVSMQVGQVGGITSGPDGVLWVFHRAFRVWSGSSFNSENYFTKEEIRWPAVLRLDRDNGSVLSAWGENSFYMPHMISLTPDGDLLVVDAGAHQAMKYSPKGKLLFTIGELLSPGSLTQPLKLCQPTHAVAARDGTIYLADGYCNSRIVVLSPKGEFHEAWDLPRGVPHGPDPLPHSLALDECRGRLYVADREAGRILAMNLENGEVQGHWSLGDSHGLPYAVRIGPYGTPVVLAWDRDGTGKTKLVILSTSIGDISSEYELPGVKSPHDFTLVPAPLELTGAGERKLAVVVAETAPKGSRLRKFVISASAEGDSGGITDMGGVGNLDQPSGLAASHAGHAMLKPVDGESIEGGDMEEQKAAELGEDGDSAAVAENQVEQLAGAGVPTSLETTTTTTTSPSEAASAPLEPPSGAASLPLEDLATPEEQPMAGTPQLDSTNDHQHASNTPPAVSWPDESSSFGEPFEDDSKWWQKNPVYDARNDPYWSNESDQPQTLGGTVAGYLIDNPTIVLIAVVLCLLAYTIVLPRIAGMRNRGQGYRNPDHMA